MGEGCSLAAARDEKYLGELAGNPPAQFHKVMQTPDFKSLECINPVELRFILDPGRTAAVRPAWRRDLHRDRKVIGAVHKLFTGGLSVLPFGWRLFFGHFSDKEICHAADTFIFPKWRFWFDGSSDFGGPSERSFGAHFHKVPRAADDQTRPAIPWPARRFASRNPRRSTPRLRLPFASLRRRPSRQPGRLYGRPGAARDRRGW